MASNADYLLCHRPMNGIETTPEERKKKRETWRTVNLEDV